jgi:hypothetical protein
MSMTKPPKLNPLRSLLKNAHLFFWWFVIV